MICFVGHLVVGTAKSTNAIIAGMTITGFGAANCQMATFALTELLPNKWRHIGEHLEAASFSRIANLDRCRHSRYWSLPCHHHHTSDGKIWILRWDLERKLLCRSSSTSYILPRSTVFLFPTRSSSRPPICAGIQRTRLHRYFPLHLGLPPFPNGRRLGQHISFHGCARDRPLSRRVRYARLLCIVGNLW